MAMPVTLFVKCMSQPPSLVSSALQPGWDAALPRRVLALNTSFPHSAFSRDSLGDVSVQRDSIHPVLR